MIEIPVKKLHGFLQKTKGLLGAYPYPVYFTTRFGVHTFGMKSPIDVLILDSQGIIVKIKENLVPNRVFFWNPLYSNVLELPSGTVYKKNIRIGTKIRLVSRF